MAVTELAVDDPESRFKVIGVDLDKTIAKNSPHPDYDLLEPIDGAWESLNYLHHHGWDIFIYTSRPWHDYNMIKDWLDRYDFEYDGIICGKLFCKWMVDDRNITFDGDWNKVLKMVK